MAIGTEFANDSEPIAETAIRKITVQKALEKLTADECFIIVRIYFEDDTDGNAEIAPKEAEIVKEIYRCYLETARA